MHFLLQCNNFYHPGQTPFSELLEISMKKFHLKLKHSEFKFFFMEIVIVTIFQHSQIHQ